MIVGEFAAGVRILLEKGPPRYHICEDQQFQKIPSNSYNVRRRK
jgi:hypothetical protein